MRFIKFLNESTDYLSVDDEQAEVKHDSPRMHEVESNSTSIVSPKVRAEINISLANEFNGILFNDKIYTPNSGFQKIRKVLHRYGLDVPVLYNLDPDGDEITFELDQFGAGKTNNYQLYVIYYMTRSGGYDFHAEIVDDDELDEILSTDEDDD